MHTQLRYPPENSDKAALVRYDYDMDQIIHFMYE